MEPMRRLRKWPLGLAGPVLAALMGLAALHLPAGWADPAAGRLEIDWSGDGAPALRLPPGRVVTVSFRELANRLGVTGTPAFLVLGPAGVQVSPGALDTDQLAGMIVDAA